MGGELFFPSREDCDSNVTPNRQVTIPAVFENVFHYRQVFKTALRGECSILVRLNVSIVLLGILWIRVETFC